jgi:hypothetical protein
MLIRRYSHRVAEAQWQAEVSAQLGRLMDVQTQIAGMASQQLKDRERQRTTWLTWVFAILALALSGVVVLDGVAAGLYGTTEAAAANSLWTQAKNAYTQTDTALRPVSSLERRKGAAWTAEATKDLAVANRWAKDGSAEFSEASADQSSADRFQLIGPGVLAFGSALGGAVLAWMLTQWFKVIRWPRRPVPRPSKQ